MARALKALAGFVVATTSSFLAYLLTEIAVLHAPTLLLAALTGVEVVGFQPQPRFPYFLPSALSRIPPEASAWLYAAQQGSYLPAALLLLLLGAIVAHRARGQVSLLASQTVLWATFFLALYSGAFGGGRFRLQRAMEALWPSFAQSDRKSVV